MTDFDDLIAPAMPPRTSFAVPNMARPTVIAFLPMSGDNPAFLDAALRKELAGEVKPEGLDALRDEAAHFIKWCTPTLTIDGVDRTADVSAYLLRLIDLAPGTYRTIMAAAAKASGSQEVKTEAVEGNSLPA